MEGENGKWGLNFGGQMRHCQNCEREFLEWRWDQRFCSPACRLEFKNRELRAARELWAREGRPSLEEVEERKVASR
jgi:hypothetical protein